MVSFLKSIFSRPPDLTGLPLGKAGEVWAKYLYKKKGFKIIAENYELRNPRKLGELDLVCTNGKVLVVVEVKTRQGDAFMDVFEAVDYRKQGYLKRMVNLFLNEFSQYQDLPVQIDVVGILMDPVDNSVRSCKIIENAIEDS